MHFKSFLLLLVLSPCVGYGQSDDTTNKNNWYHGVRFQATGGVTVKKARYREYRTGNPNTSSSFINDLAGFNIHGINPMAIGQLDYDVLRRSKKLSLYTGLGWTFSSNHYSGVKDSLIAYQLDTTVLNKRSFRNNLELTVALNAQKFFRFHAEIGLLITLFESYRFSEHKSGTWKLVGSGTYGNYSGSRIYTSIGYPFRLKEVSIAPIIRLDYYPFYKTQYAISGGISLAFQGPNSTP